MYFIRILIINLLFEINDIVGSPTKYGINSLSSVDRNPFANPIKNLNSTLNIVKNDTKSSDQTDVKDLQSFKRNQKKIKKSLGSERSLQSFRSHSYYYVARTLVYIPLYFLLWFDFYCLYLNFKSISRHKIHTPEEAESITESQFN